MCAAASQVETENPTLVVETGLNCDKISFEWKIQRFDKILPYKELINEQMITVVVPSGYNGFATKWGLYLDDAFYRNGNRAIDLYYQLLSTEPTTPMYSSLGARYRTTGRSGALHECRTTWTSNGCHKGSLVLWGNGMDGFFLEDGCLTINITISVFTKKAQILDESQSSYATVLSQEKSLEENHQKDMRRLQNDEEWSDVKLISIEGDEHPANKSILSVRSPVFAAMFMSRLEESKSGVVRLEDISSETLKIMLQYINNGKIFPDQFQALEDFENVVYAADKYELEDLREYCDKLLAAKWAAFAAPNLSELVRKFRLLNAETAMQQHVKQNSMDATNVVLGFGSAADFEPFERYQSN